MHTTDPDDGRWITAAAAASILNKSARSVHVYGQRGDLPIRRVGRRHWYLRTEVERLAATFRAATGSPAEAAPVANPPRGAALPVPIQPQVTPVAPAAPFMMAQVTPVAPAAPFMVARVTPAQQELMAVLHADLEAMTNERNQLNEQLSEMILFESPEQTLARRQARIRAVLLSILLALLIIRAALEILGVG